MKKSENNTYLTIIAVITLLISIIGATFAYFTARSSTLGEKVTTGQLKISAIAGAVNETEIIPVKATDIININSKISNVNVAKLPITVDTTGTTIPGIYNIYLTTSGIDEKVTTILGNSSHIKWELIKGEPGSEITLNSGSFDDGDVNSLKINVEPIDVFVGGTIEKYTLFVYILDNDTLQDDLSTMRITAHTTVEAVQK